MKTFRTINNKKLGIITFLLTVLLLALTTCQNGNEASKTEIESNKLLLEEKSSDNTEDANDLGKAEGKYLSFADIQRMYGNIKQHLKLLYNYEDIYIPFTSPFLPKVTWYKFNPLTNSWYSFNPNDDVFNKYEWLGFIPYGPPGWEEHDFNPEGPPGCEEPSFIPEKPIMTPVDTTLNWRI